MSRIFLVDLEAVDTRYTGQWKTHVPELLRKAGHDVQIISGPTDIPSATTPGAFLNFGGTNIYKSSQVEQMGRLFCDGAVHPYVSNVVCSVRKRNERTEDKTTY